MEHESKDKKLHVSDYYTTLLKFIVIIFIFLGIFIRILMLLYYYYIHILDPSQGWGDLSLNFTRFEEAYPLLTRLFLVLFRSLSFGYIEIFAFWGFFFDLLVCILFYFVLKSFKIKKINYAYGLFLLNAFFFLNNSFSLDKSGYHITDSPFFIFLFLSLIFYSKKGIFNKYLFYIFLGLSMSTKYYTLPVILLFFIKYLIEKDWNEMKIFLISIIPILLILIVIPTFLFPQISGGLLNWYSIGVGNIVPLPIRLIPIGIIIIGYTILRLKSANKFEIIIISTIAMGFFMFFSYPYLRWFQCIIFLGILNEKELFSFNLNLKFIEKRVNIDNHLLTFFLSFIAVIVILFFYILT